MFKCPFCYNSYQAIYLLREHIFDKHKSDNIKCPYCNFIANNWNDFAIHILTTKEKKHMNLLYILLNDFRNIQNEELGG
jgi:DNA-directed RNA polymerase subunit RPC12/RpoP